MRWMTRSEYVERQRIKCAMLEGVNLSHTGDCVEDYDRVSVMTRIDFEIFYAERFARYMILKEGVVINVPEFRKFVQSKYFNMKVAWETFKDKYALCDTVRDGQEFILVEDWKNFYDDGSDA